MEAEEGGRDNNLASLNDEVGIPAALTIANQELVYQNEEKEKRAAELIIANKELLFQNEEKEKRAAELVIANKELLFQNEEKEKRAAELIIANKELAFQNDEKENRAAELIIANKELDFQNEEKEKRAAELIIANTELLFQNAEKGKRATELVIANDELLFQNDEKEKRAAELIIANKELAFQNDEKENRAAELIIANKELDFQNEEKEKRAAELIIANTELLFQNEEKGKRATELVIANDELLFQNDEKEKRAAELIIANKELAFQNDEKEHRAAELVIANVELRFQVGEKKKRAEEFDIANHELELEKRRTDELSIAYKTISDYKYALDESSILTITDEKGIINHVNDNFCRISKYSRAELIGRDHLIVSSGYHSKVFIRNLWTTIADGKIWKGEIKNRAKDGTTYWVDTTIVPFLNKNGRPYQYIAIRSDISESKKLEEKQAVAERNILELNIDLEKKILERTTQLQQVNEELESFSYSVSHDLRAPLRAINGFTQVLAGDYRDRLDEDANSLLDEIISNSIRMGQLIDNLLEFSRLGKHAIIMVPIDAAQLVNSVVAELKRLEQDRNISVTLKDLGIVRGDKTMLRQVFINLVSNAFKYTSKKPEASIEIGSYDESSETVFYIKDNGAGFDMRYYDKLFGVFQRLHSSFEFDGTGVGLAIIHKIITKHGGRVWAEAKVDEGACFYFSLPQH